ARTSGPLRTTAAVESADLEWSCDAAGRPKCGPGLRPKGRASWRARWRHGRTQGTSLSRCPAGKCRRMAMATFPAPAGLGSCHGLAEDHLTDCHSVKAALADDDETTIMLLVGAPRAVVIALDPAADSLHDVPHRLLRNGKEALDAKNI